MSASDQEIYTIALPSNAKTLSLGSLIALALQLGVGNFDRKLRGYVSWSNDKFVRALYDRQYRRMGNKAKVPSTKTISNWCKPNSRGPGPKYWLDFCETLVPRSDRFNQHWRKTLETKRQELWGEEVEIHESHFASGEKLRFVAPKFGDQGGLPFDVKEVDDIVSDPTFKFASRDTQIRRVWGYIDQLNCGRSSTAVEEDAMYLLMYTLLRAATQIDLLTWDKANRWMVTNWVLEKIQIHQFEELNLKHFKKPKTHLLHAVLVDWCEQNCSPHSQRDQFTDVFEMAFFCEVGTNIGQYKPLIDFLFSEQEGAESVLSDLQFACHKFLIASELAKPLMSTNFAAGGEPFSLADIYLDLPLEPDVGEIPDYDEGFGDEPTRRPLTSEVLDEFIADPWILTGGVDNFLCLRGLPGSGKSSALKSNAERLSKAHDDLAIVFLPLQRHGPFKQDDARLLIRGGLPSGFLPSNSASDILAMFERSSSKKLLLILDGLDELGTQDEHQDQVMNLARALQVMAESAKSKPVKVILAGRHQAFTHLPYPRKNDEDVWRLIGMMLPLMTFKSTGKSLEESDLHYCFDLRQEWFERFMKFKYGQKESPVPHVLASHFHQLVDLTKEPLLIFLLFRLGENLAEKMGAYIKEGTRVPDFDRIFEMGDIHSLSRNDLYQMIIWSIRHPLHRDASLIERSSGLGGLPEVYFERTLACLALPAWRNGTGSRASVREFLQEAESQGLRAEALRYVTTARGRDPDSEFANLSLLSVFYFQGFQVEGSEGDEFEFTHKSFAEYLVAAHLFEEVVKTAHSLDEEPLVPDDPRLFKLIELFGQGDESIEIGQFLQEEGIRYGRKRSILFETPRGVVHLYPREGHELPIISAKLMEPLAWQLALLGDTGCKAARYVTAIWNAIVVGDEMGAHGEIKPESFTFKDLFERICAPPCYADLDQVKSSFLPTNISKVSIGHWNLIEADLSFLNLAGSTFSSCDMSGAKLANTSMHNTGLNHCMMNNAELRHCDFTSGGLYNSGGFNAISSTFDFCIIESGKFSKNELSLVNFQDSEWADCQLEKCNFTLCGFHESLIRSTDFDRCSFIQCDFTNVDFEEVNFTDCEFDNCIGLPDELKHLQTPN